MMMGHALPYYGPRLEELGYAKAKDLIAYDVDATVPWPEATQRLIARAERMPGLRIRPLDMRRYREEIRTIVPDLQRCLGGQLGLHPLRRGRGAPISPRSIRPLVDADSFAIGELDGEPVGMTVTLPNLNEAIAGLDGRLLPFGWFRLLWRLKVRGIAERADAAHGHRQAPAGHDQGCRHRPGHDRAHPAPLRQAGLPPWRAVLGARGQPLGPGGDRGHRGACPTSATASTRRRWR